VELTTLGCGQLHSRHCERSPNNLSGMAEAASIESVPARLAAIREQLSLLSDYL
jgi:hypothetical protein